jgi:hypothetical protein
MPQRPNPDTMIVAPSGMSRTASAASLTTFFMTMLPLSRVGRFYQPRSRAGFRAAGGSSTFREEKAGGERDRDEHHAEGRFDTA